MSTAWIGLGSNLGDTVLTIARAGEELSSLESTTLVKLSALYETAPVDAGGGAFINAVAMVETSMAAGKFLKSLQAMESAMGRERPPDKKPGKAGEAEARTLDLDLLLFDEETIEEPGLIVPHPRMTDRRFVMEPLAEISGDLLVPGTGKTAARIAQELAQHVPIQQVKRLGTLESLAYGRSEHALDQSSSKNL